jgi:hypothetical protein
LSLSSSSKRWLFRSVSVFFIVSSYPSKC